ncbi:MAG: hypothetical protein E2O89_07825 [Alphaproteobacteria bacterium]|nr:MAG: hypothetical protein E2O89_07825 [Alphaproteobacteria bacterium]
MNMNISRRNFLRSGTTVAATGLMALRYGSTGPLAQTASDEPYRGFEDVMRQKWTWDKVSHSTHGANCSGHCAFNVYVKNGVVWREEQQGEYGRSGDDDTPDYGPRGCQKGLRHSSYMYGPQRVLYPMKRVGERGEGKWERVTWKQALDEIADKFIDNMVEYGPDSISYDLGTAMIMKRAPFAGVSRFSAITGIQLPELFAGVGDQPTGTYMTTGIEILGDTMAAVYKSRACLIWYSNPAVTRIPDAHFFWEAKWNGTKVTAISPEFTPTAMHANRWLNPKPGTDAALALAMCETIISDGSHDIGYIREQTDLPFLVRSDNNLFLRGSDMADVPEADVPENIFYIWDEATDALVQAPATGHKTVIGPEHVLPFNAPVDGALELGDLVPTLEGSWTVETKDGPVEVTTVFSRLKTHLENYTPEKTSEITGLNPEVVRTVAREFAAAKPAMIFSGYASCKWLNTDMLQRSFLLLLSLTGNLGPEGGGFQITNVAKSDGIFAYAWKDVWDPSLPPPTRIASVAMWDYQHSNLKELNAEVYGQDLADEIDEHYQQALTNGWIPDYNQKPWKMAFYAGCNAANWRASGKNWRETSFAALETIVTMTTDMNVTALYSDYILPIAHHYERQDMIYEGRQPYVQVLDAAVPPLGKSVDDWTMLKRLCEAISRRATERNIEPINYVHFIPTVRDLKQCHDLFTHQGTINTVKELLQFLINTSSGVPKMSFDELAAKGIARVDDSDGVVFGENSPYDARLKGNYYKKHAYNTLTTRQQYYFDHEWFIKFDETLPAHIDPLRMEEYPLQLMMGHARHGIHSQWRDDSFLLGLQRGEPDIYLSVSDAAARSVEDGDLVRVFNTAGEFIVQAHISSAIQPGMMFMYHGWDPMMFHGRQNFGAVIPTAGLIKPTSLVGNYGHLKFEPFFWTPNATFKDFTCDFEKYVEGSAQEEKI